MLEDETVYLLKLLLEQAKFGTTNAIASLPAFTSFVTLLEFPVMEESETAKALQFQVRQHIPLPLSEVTLDWFKVGEKRDDRGNLRQQILLISVPNDQIAKYKKIFKAAGLNLIALEIESLSLTRILIDDPKPTIIVDIGARSTNIAVAEQGNLRMNSQTDFASGALTQAIAGGLNISTLRAEDLKKRQGLLRRNAENDLSTLMLPFVDAILSEVVRVKINYEREYNSSIAHVILAGGGAKLPGLEKYAEKQLGVTVAKGAPFRKVEYPLALEPLVADLGPTLSVALGLGIRQFV
jgi:type IV pilus assembly protein PilM